MPAEPQRKRKLLFLQTLAMAMELPFILVAGVLIGGGAGYWLDHRFHTSPLLTLILGILGFGAGVREVIRRIPKDTDQTDDR
ncbi:MAG TPA: AtpZ/AtpI family protein [Candidatus Acidoferrales bacterium]|jgi:F0F1-type ATP synthase assembly protein I|nr:AtpZ/AtpI family protein [Candidatus Acidoferrales bacterium]